MGKTAKLNIVAPGREKLTEEVISLSTSESNGNIEFLANHAPIIVATVPTVSSYTTSTGERKDYLHLQELYILRMIQLIFVVILLIFLMKLM